MFYVAYCSVTVFDEVSQMQVFSSNAPYGHYSAVAVIFKIVLYVKHAYYIIPVELLLSY